MPKAFFWNVALLGDATQLVECGVELGAEVGLGIGLGRDGHGRGGGDLLAPSVKAVGHDAEFLGNDACGLAAGGPGSDGVGLEGGVKAVVGLRGGSRHWSRRGWRDWGGGGAHGIDGVVSLGFCVHQIGATSEPGSILMRRLTHSDSLGGEKRRMARCECFRAPHGDFKHLPPDRVAATALPVSPVVDAGKLRAVPQRLLTPDAGE